MADVFTNLIVIISQYIGVSNHCMVHLNVICPLYLKTGEKIMAKRAGGGGGQDLETVRRQGGMDKGPASPGLLAPCHPSLPPPRVEVGNGTVFP